VQDTVRVYTTPHTVTVTPTLESPANLVREGEKVRYTYNEIISQSMPEMAMELMIFVSDLEQEDRESDINQIYQIFSEKGFHDTPHGDEVQAMALYFQPFEHTQENEELIKKCVEEIATKFPDLEAEYRIYKNRDGGKMPEKTCQVDVNT